MRFHLALVLAIGVAVAGAACRKPSDQRQYTLQGQVRALTPDRTEATVHHEEIKGFMASMTMPYKVRDAKQLEGIAPGDLINARLIVLSNDAYLTDIKKVGTAPLPEPFPTASPSPPASSGFELLKPGESVPDAPFVDQDGKRRRFSSFKGQPLVITFIYTRCPLPTFCPMMDRHFATVQESLRKTPGLRARVHLVTVSFDPVNDTPAVLREHAKQLGADRNIWTFLTGDRDEIDRFASRFGLQIARALNDPRDITHNLRTAIVDADGKLVKIYVGVEWTPDQVLTDLRPVVGAN
jgi:protein SCO1/2